MVAGAPFFFSAGDGELEGSSLSSRDGLGLAVGLGDGFGVGDGSAAGFFFFFFCGGADDLLCFRVDEVSARTSPVRGRRGARRSKIQLVSRIPPTRSRCLQPDSLLGQLSQHS